MRAGPADPRPGHGGAALLPRRVPGPHRRQELPGRRVQGAGARQVHQRLPGRAWTCPAYMALVAQGRYAEGLAIHRQRNPFALVCGRVCPAFCEQRCRRGEIDEPIAIRLIKRFMADQEFANPWTPERLRGARRARRWPWSAPARPA